MRISIQFSFLVPSVLIILLAASISSCAKKPTLSIQEISHSHLDEILSDRHLLIDSKSETVTILENNNVIAKFENIAWGVAGVGEKHRRGDGITPSGRFQITNITRASKFHGFIGLNYPNIEYAEKAHSSGVLSPREFQSILLAHKQNRIPPQDTILGGHLGIHGVGSGDVEIHRFINWTDGCIALENWQIDQLLSLVRPGMDVEIR